MIDNLFFIYCIIGILNLVAFVLVGIDKKRSTEQDRRIPEVYLFFMATFFASLGVFLGMLFFHHKTKKLYFTLGMALLVLQQIFLIMYIASPK